MPEHSNAAVVRRGYEAFAEGDAETLAALIAEDAVWHVGGRNLFSDTYQGREAIFTYFRKLREFTNDSLAIELHAVLADDEHAVALVHMSRKARAQGTRDERDHDLPHARRAGRRGVDLPRGSARHG